MTTSTALICGATGTLGRALVEAFAARGDEVIGVARRGGDSRAAAFEHVDLTVPAQVDALWAHLVRESRVPRWVVNAVGGYEPGSVSETDSGLYGRMHDVNVATALWSSRAAARGLDAGGAIVNVASRSAVRGGAGAVAYAVANASVVRLTEVLAAELAPRRIRVNAILPSRLDAVPPADVADVVTFLCSERAAAVTGAAIPVYGWA